MKRGGHFLVLFSLVLGDAVSTRGQAPAVPAVPSPAAPLPADAPPAPTHPCTPDQVRQMVLLTGADATSHRLMALMLQGMRTAANPAIPPSVWDEMDTSFAKTDLVAAIIPAYQRYLSQEDMEAVLSFYRTGPGQRVLAAVPYVQAVGQSAGQAIGERIGREAVEHHRDEILARQKEFDKEAAARAGAVQLTVAPPVIPPAPEAADPGDYQVKPK